MVDLDVKPDKNGIEKNGIEAFRKLAEAAGAEVPTTTTVLTPSGGKHLPFWLPSDVYVPTSHSVLGPGIDIQSEGSFVVGPGSPHRNGGIYRIEDETVPTAEAPTWLLDLVVKQWEPPQGARNRSPDDSQPTSPEGVRAIAWAKTLLASAEPAIQGQGGSNRLFHVACRLMYSALPLDVLRQLVEDVYNPRCEPPWSVPRSSTSSRTPIESLTSRAASPRRVFLIGCAPPPPRRTGLRRTWGRRAFDERTSSGDSAGSGPPGTAANANGVNGAAAPPTNPWDQLVVPVRNHWYASPPPNRKWLLRDDRINGAPGVLPLGKVGQIIAEGGAGKTMARVSSQCASRAACPGSVHFPSRRLVEC